ncbi:colicin E3/pyocin S6 family cytotoxin [Herbaspirillum rubrisubalbicans]|uniref:colicin E3/pyocin S6 family cytotoxin n=1 Tax=Herbaspirillum rubrisubalbicans TaxID=80842 RepID=UPI000DD2CAD9
MGSWAKDKKLTRINGRAVYVGNDGYLYAIDTQHGRFEKVDQKTGRHIGEINMGLAMIPRSQDQSSRHNLKVK